MWKKYFIFVSDRNKDFILAWFVFNISINRIFLKYKWSDLIQLRYLTYKYSTFFSVRPPKDSLGYNIPEYIIFQIQGYNISDSIIFIVFSVYTLTLFPLSKRTAKFRYIWRRASPKLQQAVKPAESRQTGYPLSSHRTSVCSPLIHVCVWLPSTPAGSTSRRKTLGYPEGEPTVAAASRTAIIIFGPYAPYCSVNTPPSAYSINRRRARTWTEGGGGDESVFL